MPRENRLTLDTMMKLVRLLAFVVACATAVTSFTVRPQASFAARQAMPTSQVAGLVSRSSTSLNMFGPMPYASEAAGTEPLGSILIFILFVSLWELNTPGRAKK